MDAIVAVYSDWGIGDKGTQPIYLHADRKHFASLTKDSAVIVGRKTLEDFPGGKPLKDRYNIVVTTRDLPAEGFEIAHNTQEAVFLAEKYDRCYVIGGASIFEQFMPFVDRVHVTKLECCPFSSKFFPNLDLEAGWKCTSVSDQMEEDGVKFTFCVYERI